MRKRDLKLFMNFKRFIHKNNKNKIICIFFKIFKNIFLQ
jgi:hypothetical protein